jgi:hypothetical protein
MVVLATLAGIVSSLLLPVGTVALPGPPPAAPRSFDVVVFGATPGGIMAAIAARRTRNSSSSGPLTVALVANGTHIGGFTSGGHCGNDMYQDWVFGGLAREFWDSIHKHYDPNNTQPCINATGGYCRYTHEPHVASRIFSSMLSAAGVQLFTSSLGVRSAQMMAPRDGIHDDAPAAAAPPPPPRRLVSVTTNAGDVFAGRMYIDGSYEGELLAASGVPYAVGREERERYNESFGGYLGVAGLAFAYPERLFARAINPYVNNRSSGELLPGVYPARRVRDGAADAAVMGFEFRPCLTAVAANRVDIPVPPSYDPARYELVRRLLEAGGHAAVSGHRLQNGKIMPGMMGPVMMEIPRGAW